MRLGREFGCTPDELMARFTVADLIEQVAFDILAAEEAEEWQQRQRS